MSAPEMHPQYAQACEARTKLSIGDVVQVKSGGPAMTVYGVDMDKDPVEDPTVGVTWMHDGYGRTATLHVLTLDYLRSASRSNAPHRQDYDVTQAWYDRHSRG